MEKKMTFWLKAERGMTLIEVLVVVVLISLIYVVVAKGVFGKGEAAKAQLNIAKMEKLKASIAQYRMQYNRYPSKLQDMISGPSDLRGQPFFAMADPEDLNDIWNTPFIYQPENDGRTFTLKSLGADGLEGGEGANQDVSTRP